MGEEEEEQWAWVAGSAGVSFELDLPCVRVAADVLLE